MTQTCISRAWRKAGILGSASDNADEEEGRQEEQQGANEEGEEQQLEEMINELQVIQYPVPIF